MAYALGDTIILTPFGQAPSPPQKGVCVLIGASPEVVWANGTRSILTGMGPNVNLGGYQKLSVASPQDQQAWLTKRVQPIAGALPNVSGESQGVVIEVFNYLEPVATLAALIRTVSGLYYIIATSALQVVT